SLWQNRGQTELSLATIPESARYRRVRWTVRLSPILTPGSYTDRSLSMASDNLLGVPASMLGKRLAAGRFNGLYQAGGSSIVADIATPAVLAGGFNSPTRNQYGKIPSANTTPAIMNPGE